jgi:hypothetical protein
MFIFQKLNIVFNLNNLPEKIEERHIKDVINLLGLPDCCAATFLPDEIRINIKRYKNKFGHDAAKASILLSTEGFAEEGGDEGATRQLTLVEIREVEAAWMRRFSIGLYLHVSPHGRLGAATKDPEGSESTSSSFITGKNSVYFKEFKQGGFKTRLPYLRLYASLPVMTDIPAKVEKVETKSAGPAPICVDDRPRSKPQDHPIKNSLQFTSEEPETVQNPIRLTPDLGMESLKPAGKVSVTVEKSSQVSNVETVTVDIYKGSEKPECLHEENDHIHPAVLAAKNGESTFVGKTGQVFKVIV